VAAPARQATARSFRAVGILVPAGLLAAGVLTLNVVSGGPRALALLATFGTPLLAAAGGVLAGRRRWWLWPPLAAGLWLAAWLAHGLVQDAAGLALVALACLAAASGAGSVLPASSIRVGLVALAALDVALVWGTTSVNRATTTPSSAGRSKYVASVATGVAAGLWGLLFFVTPEVAATVPVVAGLAFATADARRRRL